MPGRFLCVVDKLIFIFVWSECDSHESPLFKFLVFIKWLFFGYLEADFIAIIHFDNQSCFKP
ncbi:hypothetical protein VCHA52P455_40216 [Vibrio chagasii]|nr:hypothetical protein VCHA52P455_40216 [Vibrio chagasii]